MTATLTPSATDIIVQAPYALVKGSMPLLTELDLRGKFAAALQILVAGGGNTVLAPMGVIVSVRRKSVTTGCGDIPAFLWGNQSNTQHGLRTINHEGGYSAGAQSIAFDGSGGLAPTLAETLFFWGVDTIPTSSGAINPVHGCEGIVVAAGTSTPLIPDRPMKYAKIDNECFAQCAAWELTLDEGLYEISWDYTSSTAGEAVACMAWARRTDSYVQA